jgi:hypothetical protein
MTCFAQTKIKGELKREECLEYFNPTNELHVKNTMINWTNIYFEILSLINLDKSINE